MAVKLKLWWSRLYKSFCGRWVFSRFISFVIPYSGSVRPLVLELAPGYAKVQMKQHWCISNHLKSIHAIALINLGELTSGLALHFSMNPEERAIVVSLKISYLKKARGVITAVSNIDLSTPMSTGEKQVLAHLYDEKGDEVAIVEAIWLLGRKKV